MLNGDESVCMSARGRRKIGVDKISFLSYMYSVFLFECSFSGNIQSFFLDYKEKMFLFIKTPIFPLLLRKMWRRYVLGKCHRRLTSIEGLQKDCGGEK